LSPSKVGTPCAYPGCPAITKERYCQYHKKLENLQYDKKREIAVKRLYSTRRHKRWRKMVLARDPLCVECLKQGKIVQATIADHIIPLKEGGDWSLENGRGLCATCHNKVHKRFG
jgi:5-methylcytosine-specific restriction protein A